MERARNALETGNWKLTGELGYSGIWPMAAVISSTA
jgi:hypothetical protein